MYTSYAGTVTGWGARDTPLDMYNGERLGYVKRDIRTEVEAGLSPCLREDTCSHYTALILPGRYLQEVRGSDYSDPALS